MKLPFVGRFFGKAAPARNPGDVPRAPSGFTVAGTPRPIVQYNNVLAAHRALQHPVVFRCLNKIAISVQQVRWYAEADPNANSGEQAGARQIKALNDLLASPNGAMASDQLRFWFALSQAIYGRAPFKVGMGTLGIANGIYPLDAAFTRAMLDTRGGVRAYEYGNGEDKQVIPAKARAGAGQAYVAEIATPTLSGLMETGRNINALGAIGLPTDIIDMLLRRAWDTASGHPNSKYLVTSEKTLTQPQRDAIVEHLEDMTPGGEESGSVLFLYNTAVEVHKLDNDLNNIHSKMPLDDMSRMIAGAFGIPISLLGLGAADGAKFAGNYIESRQSFWEDTIIPGYLTPIATGLTAAICPPGAVIRFDLDTIDAVQDSRAGRAQKLEKVTFLTNDEKREIAGFPPLTEAQRTALASEAGNRTPATTTPPTPEA